MDGAGRSPPTADVASESSIAAAIDELAGDLGGLDIVVACAGLAYPGATHEMPLAAWETMIGVNLTGTFLTLKHALPHLLAASAGRS